MRNFISFFFTFVSSKKSAYVTVTSRRVWIDKNKRIQGPITGLYPKIIKWIFSTFFFA